MLTPDIDGCTLQHAGLVRFILPVSQMHNSHAFRVSLVVALLNWISETPSQRNTQATPGYLSFGMASEYTVPPMLVKHNMLTDL